MANKFKRSLTEALVREFVMLEFFRGLPDSRMGPAFRYTDLDEIERHAMAMYQNDAYFHACVDTTVAAARRVFDRYETRREG